MLERAKANDGSAARLGRRGGAQDGLTVHGRWRFVCKDRYGRIKWTEEADNLVVTQGKNYLLDAGLAAGTAITAWYLALIADTPTIDAGDTYASHSGWTEDANYDEANRVTWTPGSVASASVDNSASAAVFTMSDTTTIAGAALVSNNTKSDTAAAGAKLYSAVAFTGGDRAVVDGDTLTVTATYSLT